MDGNEIKVVIGKSIYGENRFYVAIVDKQDQYGNDLYIKKDGIEEKWHGVNCYMRSYQECLDAIGINYTIVKETDNPNGFRGTVAIKDSNM